MTTNWVGRNKVGDLIDSMQVVSEYASEANLPEVRSLMSSLLFVLTEGQYGNVPTAAVLEARGEDRALDQVPIRLDALRRLLRTFGDGEC